MTKIQLTLTDQEVELLSNYGSQLGYNLPKTAKYFISKASEMILRDNTLPVYQISPETEARGLNALEEHRQGRTTRVDDPEQFFKEL